ncbi:MAG: PRC-barrel domain-containing protein [Pseudomonadota bacterium]
MPTISTGRFALPCVASIVLLLAPVTAQETDIDARIAASDTGVGVETPEQQDGPARPEPTAPAEASVEAGEAISVEVTPTDAAAARETGTSAPEDRMAQAVDLTAEDVPLSAILGLPARGADGSERGEVEDVIVSLATGRLVAVVIGSGGLLGLGGETERVDIADISIDALGGAVVVSSSGSE